jgi:hypothetical protein
MTKLILALSLAFTLATGTVAVHPQSAAAFFDGGRNCSSCFADPDGNGGGGRIHGVPWRQPPRPVAPLNPTTSGLRFSPPTFP